MAALVAAFGTLQLASDALEARAAAPNTLPHRLSPSYGRRVYEMLDRVMPAPYVETALAFDALQRGDAAQAQRYALKLPPSTLRAGLLARVASAQGRRQLALEYEVAAYDTSAVEGAAGRLAIGDPERAYRLEALFERRLNERSTHPDAVAQVHWQMGLFANRTAWRQVPGTPAQRHWLDVASSELIPPRGSAPLSERYAIADANQADLLGDRSRAHVRSPMRHRSIRQAPTRSRAWASSPSRTATKPRREPISGKRRRWIRIP